MGPDWHEIGQLAISSGKASVGVILYLAYGYFFYIQKALSLETSKTVSALCVRVFLPCLILTGLGSAISLETVVRYWPIVVFQMIFIPLGVFLGYVGVWLFGLPSFIIPGIAFNNAISLPLILVKTLGETGAFDAFLSPDDSVKKIIKRATSYVLTAAIIHNIFRFSLGPRLLHKRNTQRHDDGDDDDLTQASGRDDSDTTSLLNDNTLAPNSIRHHHHHFHFLDDPQLIRLGHGVKDFFNPPLVAALATLVIAFIPPLRDFVFGDGIFGSVVTESLSNLGDLFAVLQLFVLGPRLAVHARDPINKTAIIYVILNRMFVIPFCAGLLVYKLKMWKSNIWPDDPVLNFMLTVISSGPPASSIAAIAQVSGCTNEEMGHLVKLLFVCNLAAPLITPAISFAFIIVRRLEASNAI